MVATTGHTAFRIRQRSSERKIAALQRYVRLCERAYARSSESMARAVRDGTVEGTVEIGRWLNRYRFLQHLRARNGGATGTSIRAT